MQLFELFRGYELAHGTFVVQRTSDKGKSEGRALTHKGPATEELWRDHLSGKGPGLGVIPLLDDNTVAWSALDIDDNKIDHANLERRIETLGLPLVVARSKSGGAHCFLFLKEPEDAQPVRAMMEQWSAALGFGGCEVFPKQVNRFDESDMGNWLNMPYLNSERTVRYGTLEGKPLSLKAFLARALALSTTLSEALGISVSEALRASRSAGSKKRLPPDTGIFKDGPPCLQLLEAAGGFPDGTRNEGLFNVAVFLRKVHGDTWEEELQKYNIAMCDPPLGVRELQTVIKSVGRKDYDYRCKMEPCASHCHRRACLERKHGVGVTTGGLRPLEIGHIAKHPGDPVIWYLEVQGRRFMMTTDELLDQRAFRVQVLEATNQIVAKLPQPRWEAYLNERLANCDIVEVPEDATLIGQLRGLVDEYLTGRAQSITREELLSRGAPYNTGSGEIWFRSAGLLEFLQLHNFRYQSPHHIWQSLREFDAKHLFLNIGGRGLNVWVLPAPGELPEESVETQGEVPF